MADIERATKSTSGPCVILAGAGTGKTYTIIKKIEHLLASDIPADKIVCLTFSNEAVNSLRERAMKLLEDKSKEPIIRTFHSFCSGLLEEHGSNLGLGGFKVLLPDDAKIMLHKNFKINSRLCSEYVGTIGIAKDLGISVEDLENYVVKKNIGDLTDLENELKELQFSLQIVHLEYKGKDKDYKTSLKEKIDLLSNQVRTKKFLQAWKNYEKLKSKKNLLDYSDLNVYALKLLDKNPGLVDVDYVIVDEFQDTNKLQVELLSKLGRNITVVGDLNQSIYRFRGAYKDNLTLFRKLFSVRESDIYALDKSHRSSNSILRVAHKLIQNNYDNKEECFPVYNAYNVEGDKVEVYELMNVGEENRKIVELIKDELARGTSAEKICVMFRTHQQARSLKTYLEASKIDYVSVTKKSLLKTSSIKLVCEYLTVLQAIKNNSKGYDKTWWELVFSLELDKEDSILLGDYIRKNREQELSKKMLSSFEEIKLSEVGKVKLKLLIDKIAKLISKVDLPVPELIVEVYKIAGLYPAMEDSLEKEKLLILEKFLSLGKDFVESDSPHLRDFLYHLQIIEDLGIEIEAPSLENKGVRLMTNHATKGLEYDVVIVSSLAQKRFPLERYSVSLVPVELLPELGDLLVGLNEDEQQVAAKQYEIQASLLEERRLCYVAFTRAKRRLVLTYAQQYGSRADLPSQFLNEIDYQNNSDIVFARDLSETSGEIVSALEIEDKATRKHNVPQNLRLSPSAMQCFSDCQKRYEYRYIYNMPDEFPDEHQRIALKLGSFVHVVFDRGVKANYKTEKEFVDLARILGSDEDWGLVDVEEAIPLIKVFFARNKDKYSEKSVTEQKLYVDLDGIKFIGVADRIDFHSDGVEIIDYKTGASDITPKHRNWQLGLYALAAVEKYGPVKRVTLDMLKKERPLEFDLDTRGNAVERNSHRMNFNVLEVREELVSIAKDILQGYNIGFKACPSEKNCEFCLEMGFKEKS